MSHSTPYVGAEWDFLDNFLGPISVLRSQTLSMLLCDVCEVPGMLGTKHVHIELCWLCSPAWYKDQKCLSIPYCPGLPYNTQHTKNNPANVMI